MVRNSEPGREDREPSVARGIPGGRSACWALRRFTSVRSIALERAGDGPEHRSRLGDARGRHSREDPSDCRLDGGRGSSRKRLRVRANTQFQAPPVLAVPFAREQPLVDETLHNAGDRAGMETNDVSEFSCRQSRELVDESEHQALRPGDANGGLHLLRSALEAVLDAPEQTHEIQGWVQRRGLDANRCDACHSRQHT
jgi:hypothetical protein